MGKKPTEEDVWKMIMEYAPDGEHLISKHRYNEIAEDKFKEIVLDQKKKVSSAEDDDICTLRSGLTLQCKYSQPLEAGQVRRAGSRRTSSSTS